MNYNQSKKLIMTMALISMSTFAQTSNVPMLTLSPGQAPVFVSVPTVVFCQGGNQSQSGYETYLNLTDSALFTKGLQGIGKCKISKTARQDEYSRNFIRYQLYITGGNLDNGLVYPAHTATATATFSDTPAPNDSMIRAETIKDLRSALADRVCGDL